MILVLFYSLMCPPCHHTNSSISTIGHHIFGAVHKVRHARGGPSRCDSLWQGEGVSSACDVTLIHFLSYILNMKF